MTMHGPMNVKYTELLTTFLIHVCLGNNSNNNNNNNNTARKVLQIERANGVYVNSLKKIDHFISACPILAK